jgi:galactose mutarotase-like enzyme
MALRELVAILACLAPRLAAQPYSVGSAEARGGPALIVLLDEGGGMEAAIAPSRGGELSSLRVRHRDRWIETLYLARDYSPREDWTGKAPHLWPATGSNFPADVERRIQAGERANRGGYDFAGKRYRMPAHGFARQLPWRVEAKSAGASQAAVSLVLEDTAETRAMYPFRFRAEVEYVVAKAELRIQYHIRSAAANQQEMFFSIGNHVTFALPFVAGTDPREVVLTTPLCREILKANGIPTGDITAWPHTGGVRLGALPVRAAVTLTGCAPEEPYVVLRDPQGLSLRISHKASELPPEPAAIFNLWGDPAAGFFSPEPWVGLQNSLASGKGLIRVKPGREFTWTIRVGLI